MYQLDWQILLKKNKQHSKCWTELLEIQICEPSALASQMLELQFCTTTPYLMKL
jgi:hypothetical protein